MRLEFDEDGRRMTVDLPSGTHLLGRGAEADVRLQAPSVSRHHAMLHVADEGLWVEDLGSAWGTFVDGRRVDAAQRCAVPRDAVLHFARVRAWNGRGGVKDAPALPRPCDEPDDDLQTVSWYREEDFGQQRSGRMLRHLLGLLQDAGPDTPIEQEGCLFVRDWLDVDRVCLRDTDQPGFALQTRGWWSRSTVDDGTRCISRSIVDHVLETGQVAVWSSRPGGETDVDDSWVDLDITHAAAVPVRADPDVRGVLYVDRIGRGPAFDEEEIEVLLAAARAVAVSREIVVTTLERDEAAGIQMRMLPEDLPSIPGHEIDAGLILCRMVGGDLYDVVSRPDGRFMFIVGDVSGKGLTAALIAAGTILLFRALAGLGLEPDAVYRAMHETLSEKLDLGQFVAVFLAELDPSTGHVECIAGGLPYPFVVRADGGLERIPVTALPLALLEQSAEPRIHAWDLAPGDLLVVATDGYEEATFDHETILGIETVESWVVENRDRSLIEIRDGLDEKVDAFVGHAGVSDDQTVLLLRRLGG